MKIISTMEKNFHAASMNTYVINFSWRLFGQELVVVGLCTILSFATSFLSRFH